jgi:hypothetical protein
MPNFLHSYNIRSPVYRPNVWNTLCRIGNSGLDDVSGRYHGKSLRYKRYFDRLTAFRSFLYALARFLGDVNAVKRGRVGRRIGRRVAGKVTGRALGKLFR